MNWKFWQKKELETRWFLSTNECYEALLYPFEIILTDPTNTETIQEAVKYLSSNTFRQALFEANLVASDEVLKLLKEYGESEMLREHGFTGDINFYKKLVLSIRKHVGVPDTKITEDDLLFFPKKDGVNG